MSDKFNGDESIFYFTNEEIKKMYTGKCSICGCGFDKPSEVFATIDKDGVFIMHLDCERSEFYEDDEGEN